jgi:hypothetical protein
VEEGSRVIGGISFVYEPFWVMELRDGICDLQQCQHHWASIDDVNVMIEAT